MGAGGVDDVKLGLHTGAACIVQVDQDQQEWVHDCAFFMALADGSDDRRACIVKSRLLFLCKAGVGERQRYRRKRVTCGKPGVDS